MAGLQEKGFEILEVSTEDAFKFGVDVISLGSERVISTAGSVSTNERLRSLRLEVLGPDLSMFSSGAGAHCLGQFALAGCRGSSSTATGGSPAGWSTAPS